eukprot:scaffold1001_cov334-Prasinococcus_capsulatus_cf.AAC.19
MLDRVSSTTEAEPTPYLLTKGPPSPPCKQMTDKLQDPTQPNQTNYNSTPYRIVMGEVRQKLLNTRKRMEDLLAGRTPSEDAWYEKDAELAAPLLTCYHSLHECSAGVLADGKLLDLLRRLHTFGLTLMKLDLRQEAGRHTEAISAITQYLGLGDYSTWDEDAKIAWLEQELRGKRPLLPPNMSVSELPV